MQMFQQLPAELREAIYRAWRPEAGLSADAIRCLLARVDLSMQALAQEAGVKEHYLNHVCTRIRRSERVEGIITRHLAKLGLTQDIIWGSQAPKRPSLRLVKAPFEVLPAFSGRFLKNKHRALLLVDTETSGPDAKKHRAIEVAMVLVAYHRHPTLGYRLLGVLDSYTGLQDPRTDPVDPFAMRIHGIPLASLRGREFDLKKMATLVSRASYLVAHNASFDRRFLGRDLPWTTELSWLCSYRDIDWKALGWSSAALGHLGKDLPIQGQPHRAYGDLITLYQILDAELPDGRRGIEHLLSGRDAQSDTTTSNPSGGKV